MQREEKGKRFQVLVVHILCLWRILERNRRHSRIRQLRRVLIKGLYTKLWVELKETIRIRQNHREDREDITNTGLECGRQGGNTAMDGHLIGLWLSDQRNGHLAATQQRDYGSKDWTHWEDWVRKDHWCCPYRWAFQDQRQVEKVGSVKADKISITTHPLPFTTHSYFVQMRAHLMSHNLLYHYTIVLVLPAET